MRKYLLSCLVLLLGISMSSCSSDNEIFDQTHDTEDRNCIGTAEFVTSLNNLLTSTPTRSIGDEETMIPALIEASIEYLSKNEISYTDFCSDKTDPRIAVIAIGLAEYDLISNIQTRTSFGGCVLQAVGVKDLGKAGAKAAAKQIGKAVLKKAVPYIGWGLFAVDLAMCLAD